MAQDLDAFRAATRAWLEANCPESMRKPAEVESDRFWGGRKPTFASEDQKVWFERCRDKNWTIPYWPKEYGGGGLSKEENKILQEEMKRLGCRPPLSSFGITMLGPVLLKYGTEEQKRKLIPEICRGETRWCQGYSEPGAGSDLAGLRMKAESDGDYYVLNGQKTWTSYADKADRIFCLVRTDPKAKHRGISFLLVDMDNPGVSTRPIELISGSSAFCETFFDNVRVPKSNLVGNENEGWTIAKYLLTHERTCISAFGESTDKRTLGQIAMEQVGLEDGKLADPVLRQEVARVEMNLWAFALTLERAGDELKAGQGLGDLSSLFKYYGTELNKDRYELLISLAGSQGLAWEGEAFDDGWLARTWLRTKGNSIEGGTSEIMLNVLAKRVLDLPT
jgi:acyl-CoA dehydrogenase